MSLHDPVATLQALADRQAAENARLRAALEPFGEVARRLGWDKLQDDDPHRNEHIIEAPAEDVVHGAVYCLQVSEFVAAAEALNQQEGASK